MPDPEEASACRDHHSDDVLSPQNQATRHSQSLGRDETASDPDAVVQHLHPRLDATLEGVSDESNRLLALSNSLVERYNHTRSKADLDALVRTCHRGLEIPSAEADGSLKYWHTTLGSALHYRYTESGDLSDLAQSIQHCRTYLRLLQEASPEFARAAFMLGFVYDEKLKVSGALEDANLAVEYYQKAVDSTHGDDGQFKTRLKYLANAYESRIEHTGALEDVDSCISVYTQLLETISTAPEDALRSRPALEPRLRSDRAILLKRIGLVHETRFKSTGAVHDAELCLERYEESVDLTDDASDRCELLIDMGWVYASKYDVTCAMRDSELAIDCFQKALQSVPLSHPRRPEIQSDMCRAFANRFHNAPALSHLETWIHSCEQAVETTPSNSLDRSLSLSELANALLERYRAVGADADLGACIHHSLEALTIGPADLEQRGRIFGPLYEAYSLRYDRTSAMSDLEAALRYCWEALDASPAYEPLRAAHLGELGQLYRTKYERTGVEADFDAALQQLRGILAMTDVERVEREWAVKTMANLYLERSQKTGDPSYLDEGIQLLRDSLGTSQESHQQNPDCIEALSRALHSRYLATRSVTDLEECLGLARISLDAVSNESRELCIGLMYLGRVYFDRYVELREPTDLELAIRRYQDAFHHASASGRDKFRISLSLFERFSDIEDWDSAFTQATTAMSIIPTLAARSLRNSDKKDQLRFLKGFASTAAAAALLAEKPPYEAVRLLEIGRGVIISALADIRSDVSDLQLRNPALGEEYLRLRERLEFATNPDERYETAKEFDRVLKTIREQPGLEDFLGVPSEQAIKAAAVQGCLVIINANKLRCDALIITQELIECLPLPRLNYSDVQDRAAVSSLTLGLNDLEWLWDTITEPILNHLGYTQRPDTGVWPRIWWIPVGLLTKFPLHAAGYHFYRSSRTVLDRVISSYTTSIKALIHARKISTYLPQEHVRGSLKAVLLGLEVTPGMNRLPFASKEVTEIATLCTSMHVRAVQPSPHRQEVLAALQDCQLFHFAGHSRNHSSDPMESSLLLRDKPVTVVDLFDLNLQTQRPFLAFLSACGTSQVRDSESLDEGLHLAVACQLAGFRHAIGSLWEVQDKTCVRLAILLYEWMRDHSMSEESVSEGLHHASKELRDEWFAKTASRSASRQTGDRGQAMLSDLPTSKESERSSRTVLPAYDDAPLSWVPYVHFGI